MSKTYEGNESLPKIQYDNVDYILQISIENDKIKICLKPIDSEIPFFLIMKQI